MSDSLTIKRESALAWWCPVDDHSNAQSSVKCGGCGAVRDGDKVTPLGNESASGSSEKVDALKARVAELEGAAKFGYDDLSPEALAVEADKRGVTPAEGSGSGKDGNVVKADLVKALTDARESAG